MNKKDFASFIKKERVNRKLSQCQFATLIDVSPMTVWRWENQENTPADNIIDMWINKIRIIK